MLDLGAVCCQVLTYMDHEERRQLILLSSLLTWARMERPSTSSSGGLEGSGGAGGTPNNWSVGEPVAVPMGAALGSGSSSSLLLSAARAKYSEDDYQLRRPAVSSHRHHSHHDVL